MVVEDTTINIGDRVCTKNFGALAPSNIVSVMTADVYRQIMGVQENFRWEAVYPNWKDGHVVLCQYDTPVRMSSFDDFMKTLNNEDEISIELMKFNPELYKKVCKRTYEAAVTPVTYMAFPLEDIEIL